MESIDLLTYLLSIYDCVTSHTDKLEDTSLLNCSDLPSVDNSSLYCIFKVSFGDVSTKLISSEVVRKVFGQAFMANAYFSEFYF